MRSTYIREGRKRRGFTLVELLAVVLIIGVLALAAAPVTGRMAERRKYDVCETEMDSIESAMQSMMSVEGVTSVADTSDTLQDISGADKLQSYLSRPIDEIEDPWGNEYQVYVQRSPGKLKIYLYSESSESPNDSFDGVSNIRCNPHKSDAKMLRVIINRE